MSKTFNGVSWPVDGIKANISLDAGPIVAHALRSFTKELKVRCDANGGSLFRPGAAGLKKYRSVPCVFVDAYDGELWGGCDEYYAISTLDSLLNGAIQEQIDDLARDTRDPDEVRHNLDCIQQVLDKFSAMCSKAKDACRS